MITVINLFCIILYNNNLFYILGDPLYVGFDLTIASFDSISEVSMVSKYILYIMELGIRQWAYILDSI